MREQLIRRCAFRAKIALTDRTFRIAFDRNELPAFVINELPATDPAVWTNRSRYLRIVDSRMHCARLVRHRFQPCAVGPLTNLTNERPFGEQRSERRHVD